MAFWLIDSCVFYDYDEYYHLSQLTMIYLNLVYSNSERCCMSIAAYLHAANQVSRLAVLNTSQDCTSQCASGDTERSAQGVWVWAPSYDGSWSVLPDKDWFPTQSGNPWCSTGCQIGCRICRNLATFIVARLSSDASVLRRIQGIFTLHPSVDGYHWLCMGGSRNALWVHPFCRHCCLRQKLRNVQLFRQRRIRRPIRSRYANIRKLTVQWNRLCNTNTWIRQKAPLRGRTGAGLRSGPPRVGAAEDKPLGPEFRLIFFNFNTLFTFTLF